MSQGDAGAQGSKTSAATVIIAVVVLLLVLLICGGVLAALLLPAVVKARQKASETRATNALRQISIAQELYKESDADGNGVNDYAPSLGDLVGAKLIDDPELATGTQGGYVFTIEIGADPKRSFRALAEPEDAASGLGSFRVDETGAVRPAPE
jgi:hypothetical protein